MNISDIVKGIADNRKLLMEDINQMNKRNNEELDRNPSINPTELLLKRIREEIFNTNIKNPQTSFNNITEGLNIPQNLVAMNIGNDINKYPYIDKAIERYLPYNYYSRGNSTDEWTDKAKLKYLQDINNAIDKNPNVKEVPVPFSPTMYNGNIIS